MNFIKKKKKKHQMNKKTGIKFEHKSEGGQWKGQKHY